MVLDNNADKPALAVINDLLHGILKLYLAFFADSRNLASDAILHKLFNGFAKNIGFPDTLAPLATLINIFDQILRLLLRSYDRSNLCFYICFDHMDGRTLGFNLDSVFISLPDHFGLFDLYLI